MRHRADFPYDSDWDLDDEATRWERRLRRKRAVGRLAFGALGMGAMLVAAGALVVIGGGPGLGKRLQSWDGRLWEPTLAESRTAPPQPTVAVVAPPPPQPETAAPAPEPAPPLPSTPAPTAAPSQAPEAAPAPSPPAPIARQPAVRPQPQPAKKAPPKARSPVKSAPKIAPIERTPIPPESLNPYPDDQDVRPAPAPSDTARQPDEDVYEFR